MARFQNFISFFLSNYWLMVRFQNFLIFLYFFSGTTSPIFTKLWFLFMLWHSAANSQSLKNLSHFCIFLRNYWSYLDQTLIFVHAVVLCSHLQSFKIFCIFRTAESVQLCYTNRYGVVVIVGVEVIVSMVNFFSFDVTIRLYPSLDSSG